MADNVVNQGLDRIAINASQAAGYDAARYIRSFTVDDSTTAFTQTSTTLSSPTNLYKRAFDATPAAPSSQVVTHVVTIPAADAAFTHRRIALHDDTTTNVTGSSTTLVAGIDGLQITKPGDVPFEYRVSLTYSDQTA